MAVKVAATARAYAITGAAGVDRSRFLDLFLATTLRFPQGSPQFVSGYTSSWISKTFWSAVQKETLAYSERGPRRGSELRRKGRREESCCFPPRRRSMMLETCKILPAHCVALRDSPPDQASYAAVRAVISGKEQPAPAKYAVFWSPAWRPRLSRCFRTTDGSRTVPGARKNRHAAVRRRPFDNLPFLSGDRGDERRPVDHVAANASSPSEAYEYLARLIKPAPTLRWHWIQPQAESATLPRPGKAA